MNYWVTYPLTTHPYNPEFTTKEALTRFCQVAEAAGFAGIGFTDHPAPTERWLKAGGHDALDPFAALSFCAAVTDRMRLIPNILVLPYRNPFVVAKSVATLDALSGGRFTLAVATGYMRGEYKALGVDFEERNALLRRGDRGHPRHLERGGLRLRGLHLRGQGTDGQPQALAAPADLDRREQPHVAAPCRPLRRRLEPVSRPQGPVQHRQDAVRSRPSTTSARCSTSSGSSWRRRAGTRPASTSSFGTGAGGRPGQRHVQPRGPAGRRRRSWRRSA